MPVDFSTCEIYPNLKRGIGLLSLKSEDILCVMRKDFVKISDWLDERESEGLDISRIALPDELAFNNTPDETIYFEEINPCGIFCTANHPFSTVERFGNWYYARGQDKKAGIHSSEMGWWLLTRDKDLALATARSHIK